MQRILMQIKQRVLEVADEVTMVAGQCDRSKATGTVWHKEPEQQRFKKNVKVRAEAQKVERLEVSRARNDK